MSNKPPHYLIIVIAKNNKPKPARTLVLIFRLQFEVDIGLYKTQHKLSVI